MGGLSSILTEDTPEARDFLRSRLSFYLGLIAALSWFFYLAGALVTALLMPEHLAQLYRNSSSRAHLVASVLALVMLALARWSRAGVRALDLLDVLGTLLLCAAFSLMLNGQGGGPSPELVVVLAVSWTLVVRAAIVPSPPLRTAAVTVLGMAPVIAATYLTAIAPPSPGMRALYVGFWAVVAVTATTVLSHVIYGLRRQIRAAARVGQYTLEEPIGQGGMGVVYRARHALLRRPTAIKLLLQGRGGARDLARFEREVQMTSALTHPNTVAVYDYGRTPDGTFYYVMEHLDGFTLEDLVRVDGPQPSGRVARVLAQCCGALEEAHAAGLVHRDVKPANVMLTTRGGVPDVVKVLDFGLVRVAEDAIDASGKDHGVVQGTPHYIAPEAIASPEAVDARTDLYSLGATAYFMLAGAPVFEASTMVEACAKHLHEQPVAPSQRGGEQVSPELEALVMSCLDKDPKRRPASAAELASRLRALGPLGWSDDDARAWWQRHGARVEAAARSRQRPAGEGPGRGSVIVDLSARP